MWALERNDKDRRVRDKLQGGKSRDILHPKIRIFLSLFMQFFSFWGVDGVDS